MDTYSSIINNNMNTVMKTLTTVSILMMFPTLIASIFGMNLINGMENNVVGFPIALVLSVAVSAFAWWMLHRQKLV
jgi:magnesium transporter